MFDHMSFVCEPENGHIFTSTHPARLCRLQRLALVEFGGAGRLLKLLELPLGLSLTYQNYESQVPNFLLLPPDTSRLHSIQDLTKLHLVVNPSFVEAYAASGQSAFRLEQPWEGHRPLTVCLKPILVLISELWIDGSSPDMWSVEGLDAILSCAPCLKVLYLVPREEVSAYHWLPVLRSTLSLHKLYLYGPPRHQLGTIKDILEYRSQIGSPIGSLTLHLSDASNGDGLDILKWQILEPYVQKLEVIESGEIPQLKAPPIAYTQTTGRWKWPIWPARYPPA